jgi:hypothetical protein
MTADEVAAHIGQGREHRSGSGWSMPCPAHDDSTPSLSVSEGREGRVVIICHAGCELGAVLVAANLDWNDLFGEESQHNGRAEIVGTYDYVDEDGQLLFQVVRYAPKTFRQRRPDSAGGWTWKLDNVRRVPYRLPELLAGMKAGRWIVVVEGEKDVDRLIREGFAATTNAGGATRFLPEFATYFTGAKVAILPDNDGPGRAHGKQVASTLHDVADEVRVVTLPGLKDHGDVSDWLDAGGSADELKCLILAALTWEPQEPAGDATDDDLGDLGVVCLADVAPERVDWLWPGRIPRGKLVILEGDPKVGKSTLALDLAARVTTGSPMPDDARLPGPGTVIVMTAEDGLADTVRPRLDAAGADPARVHAWESVPVLDDDGNPTGIRPPSIPQDLGALECLIIRHRAVLVVVDVLSAYLGAGVDGHRDQDVRRALMPLAKLAERTGAAIVVIRHLNKSGGSHAMYRGGGSIGIAGAARSILLCAPDPDDESETRRVLAVTGCNIAAPVPALAYHLAPAVEHDCARVMWDGTSEHTSDTLLAAPVDDDERSDRHAVAEVIGEVLADGPRPREEVVKAIRGAGLTVSEKTIQRTCRALGIERRRNGFGPGATFVLALPEQHMADKSEKAPVTQDAVHYVQNGPDQEYRDDVTSMVDMVDTLSDASCPDGADMQEEAIAALFPGAKLVSEDQADAEPIADPYHCLYCGARVTPAPASVENGWVTVCRSCTAAGR